MFSKSLFKQSCKANGFMWIVITVAVCFMLSCVMLIAGGGSLSDTKVSVENAVIEGELTTQTQKRALNYYDTTDTALAHFNQTYAAAVAAGKNAQEAYGAAVSDYTTAYYAALLQERGFDKDSVQGQELLGLLTYVLNPKQSDGTHMFDSFYEALEETPPRYENVLAALPSADADVENLRQNYAMYNSTVFLAGNMVQEDAIQLALRELAAYGVTRELYAQFGFDNYAFVRETARKVLVDYRANLTYRIASMRPDETVQSIKAELMGELSQSLLENLPQDVANAVKEIGEADLYGTLVGSIFFKMAGLLLPIIYMIMTSNALIAGQVDSGSMAYVLSTGTKRKEVTCTQALYLVGSLCCMFALTTVTGIVCLAIVDVNTGLNFGKLALLNLGAFLVMFAMSGICYLSSCVFNRSKHSMALGGGLNMFFLVATMLGLFGSPVLPSIIRMGALNAFNYVSLISLFDVVSILEGTFTFLWKWAILAAVGVVCYIAGSKYFAEKDLPL